MNMEDYEPKQRFRRVITNTFPSEEDCDIFIMLLKTQWPKHIDKMPKSELEITRSMESPNIMAAIWTFYDAKHFQILERLSKDMVYPYRTKLSPKSVTIKTESLCLISGG